MTASQEAEIVRRVLEGDADAFGAIVDEYQKNVYNLALRMTGNPEDAQDMSQEDFIKAFNSLESFRGDSKLSVWLYRIVSNVGLDFLRSRKRRQTVSLKTWTTEGRNLRAGKYRNLSAMPEEELNRRLTQEAVRKGLLSLPEDQREILLLREIEGLSYDEIAQALGLEAGTVKSRIFRARKRLCAQLVSGGNIPDGFTSEKAKEA